MRIRVVRAETIQYVEKAYVQDSVQLFFAVIAGVTGIFGIWTGAFYGWGVLVYEKILGLCKKNAKTEPGGNRNMKAKQTTVDKFTNSEIEELKRQLVENTKQIKELRNLLSNSEKGKKVRI